MNLRRTDANTYNQDKRKMENEIIEVKKKKKRKAFTIHLKKYEKNSV